MTGDATPWDGDHPDELLSALVDGELDWADEPAVSTHVAACEDCAAAVEDVRGARDLLHGLPVLDAGPMVDSFLRRHQRVITGGTVFVSVAAAVLAVLALTAPVVQPVVVPELEEMAAAHEAGLDTVGTASSSSRLRALISTDLEGRSFVAPAGLIGSGVKLARESVYDGADLTAAAYRSGGVRVSVFQQPGRLDWQALPGGSTEDLGGRTVWFGVGGDDLVVAVAEVGDLVVTVVSDDDAAAITAVSGMPERHRRSLFDRVHSACQRFTRTFALDG